MCEMRMHSVNVSKEKNQIKDHENETGAKHVRFCDRCSIVSHYEMCYQLCLYCVDISILYFMAFITNKSYLQ